MECRHRSNLHRVWDFMLSTDQLKGECLSTFTLEVFLFSPFSLARENLCCQGRFEREKIVQITLRHFESCHVASTSSLFPGLLNHIMLQASRDWIALDCAAAEQQKKMLQNLMHLPTAEQYLHQVNIMVLKLDLRMLL